MAPAHTRKRKSAEMEEPNTPTGSPAVKKMRITQSQKQALIDNLQLEITERARHLRAHYALQCADLRARIERRINRVPISMRTMTMGELMAKHGNASKSQGAKAMMRSPAGAAETRPLPSIPANKAGSPTRQQQIHSFPQPPRARKRKSSEIHIASDKENEPEMTVHQIVSQQDTLPVQKNNKRTKTAAGGTRTASRSKKGAVQTGAGGVLSPRSHNSRTLPRSPIKDEKSMPQSPNKPSYIARPVSPLKSAANAATSALSAAAYGLAKRGAAAGAKLANSSRPTITDKESRQGQMLPPPRPGTNLNAMSPVQRTTSQNSNRSVSATSVSEQSTTSTNTVITKPKRGATATKSKTKPATTATKKATTAVMSPVKPIASPKAKVAKKTTVASKAASAVKRGVSKKEKAAPTPAEQTTGRVLRKRN